jgi:hypothetical protein
MPNSKPQRIQRRRTAGWRMPEGAVYVGRPTKWGNPFKVGEIVPDDLMPYVSLLMKLLNNRPDVMHGLTKIRLLVPQDIVTLYELWLVEQPHLMLSTDELAGRDLACWCPPGSPCHADALLDLANGGDA